MFIWTFNSSLDFINVNDLLLFHTILFFESHVLNLYDEYITSIWKHIGKSV